MICSKIVYNERSFSTVSYTHWACQLLDNFPVWNNTYMIFHLHRLCNLECHRKVWTVEWSYQEHIGILCNWVSRRVIFSACLKSITSISVVIISTKAVEKWRVQETRTKEGHIFDRGAKTLTTHVRGNKKSEEKLDVLMIMKELVHETLWVRGEQEKYNEEMKQNK